MLRTHRKNGKKVFTTGKGGCNLKISKRTFPPLMIPLFVGPKKKKPIGGKNDCYDHSIRNIRNGWTKRPDVLQHTITYNMVP